MIKGRGYLFVYNPAISIIRRLCLERRKTPLYGKGQTGVWYRNFQQKDTNVPAGLYKVMKAVYISNTVYNGEIVTYLEVLT